MSELIIALGLRDESDLKRFLRAYSWHPKLSREQAEAYLLRCGWTRFEGRYGGWLSPAGIDWSEGEAVKIARMNRAVQWLRSRKWGVTAGCFGTTADGVEYYQLIFEMRRPGGGYIKSREAWRSALKVEARRA